LRVERKHPRIDSGQCVQRLVQPRDVLSLAISAQIIDLGIVMMHANLCRGDWVASKFALGIDEVVKRLRRARRGSCENGGAKGRSDLEFR
jgi:hypothetical protein